LSLNLMALRNLRHARPGNPNRRDNLKLVVVMPSVAAPPQEFRHASQAPHK